MTEIMIPEAALKNHIAFLGMNGSGKTSVVKSQIIEPAFGRWPTCLQHRSNWRRMGPAFERHRQTQGF